MIPGLAKKTPEELATFGAKNFTDIIKNNYAHEAIVGPEFEAIQSDLINYFVYGSAPVKPDANFYIKRYAEFLSDFIVNQEVFNETDAKVKRGWPVYFYLWNHMSAPVQATLPAAQGFLFFFYEFGAIHKFVGAWHTTELYYTFDELTFSEDVLGELEHKVQNHFADIFAAFAYTG